MHSAMTALSANNFAATLVTSKKEALAQIQEWIPKGASVANGASRTLEEIGYIDLLKSNTHGWDNLHEKVLAEKDQVKQAYLRKETTIADYYLGSVHALTENGMLLIASNSGSQLPSIAFNAKNLIFVVGQQKIVADLAAAFTRVKEVVIPLEDERMKGVYGFGTMHAKTLVLHKENAAMGRTARVILVQENLGF